MSGDPLDNVPVEAWSELRTERDRYIRAFNSLEKAVTKHAENCIDCDEDAHLVRAHRTVMRLLSERKI